MARPRRLVSFLACALLSARGVVQEGVFVTIAGGFVVQTLTNATRAPVGNASSSWGYVNVSSYYADGAGTAAAFSGPVGVSVDASTATVFVADARNHAIRAISFAGNASAANATATAAAAAAAVGNASAANATAVAPSWGAWASSVGSVTTVMGNGTGGFVDGGASVARLRQPCGVSVASPALSAPGAPAGTPRSLAVADTGNHAVRVVVFSAAGDAVLSTLAGGAALGWADGVGTSAAFASPAGLDASTGTVFVADTGNNVVRAVATSFVGGAFVGAVATVAGGGPAAAGGADGGASSARFRAPRGVCVDSASGTVYVADTGNSAIRAIRGALGGGGPVVVSTVAGGGGAGGGVAGFRDATPAAAAGGSGALFSSPSGIAFDASRSDAFRNGSLLVADTGNRAVRRVAPATGAASTVAGPAAAPATGYAASFASPAGVAVQSPGNATVFLTDASANTTLLLPLNAPAAQVAWSANRTASDSSALQFQQFAVDGLATLEGATLPSLQPPPPPSFMAAAAALLSPPRNATPPLCGGGIVECAVLANFTHAIPRLNYATSLQPAPSTFALDFGAPPGPYAGGVITAGCFFAAVGALAALCFGAADVCVNLRCRKRWTQEEKLADFAVKDFCGRLCGPRFCFTVAVAVVGVATIAAVYYATVLNAALGNFGASVRSLSTALDAAAAAAATVSAPAQRLSSSAALLVQLTSGPGVDPDAPALAANASTLQAVAGWGVIAAAASDAAAAAAAAAGTSASSMWTAVLSGAVDGVPWDTAVTYVSYATLSVPSVVGLYALLAAFTLTPALHCASYRRYCGVCDLLAMLLAWVGLGLFFAITLVLGDMCVAPHATLQTVISTVNPGAFAASPLGVSYGAATFNFYLACNAGGAGAPLPTPPASLFAQWAGAAPQSLYLPGGGGSPLLPLALAGVAELGNLSIAPLGPFAGNASLAWGARAPQASILDSAARNLWALGAAEASLVDLVSCTTIAPPLFASLDSLCGTAFFASVVVTLTTGVAALAMLGLLVCAVFLCRFHPGDVRATVASMAEATDGTARVGPRKSGMRFTAEGGRLLVARAVGVFFSNTKSASAVVQEVATTIDPDVIVPIEASWAPPHTVVVAPKVILTKAARRAQAAAAAAADADAF